MITESRMTYQEALKVLGAVGRETKAELSRIFKRASLRNHPDRGGSTEAMQKLNQAYDVVTKTGGTGGRSETFADRNARYKQERAEAESRADAYFVVTKNYFNNKFNAREFAEYFTSFTNLPTTFTVDFAKASYGVSTNFRFRSGDAFFDFQFTGKPPAAGGLSSPEMSSHLGNVSVYTDVLIGTKKHKMARREYSWDKNPDRITPESLFPASRLKAIFSVETVAKQSKLKRSDYMTSFAKHLNASISGDDITVPVGDLLFKFHRKVFMKKGIYYFDSVMDPKVSRFRSAARLTGAIQEDEEGAALDMILDTVKELQKLKPTDPQTIVNVISKMCHEFTAGHRSASFVKRMATAAEAKAAMPEKRKTSRITKEDYMSAFKGIGATTRSSTYFTFDTGAGIKINFNRKIENRKGLWYFSFLKADTLPVGIRIDVEIPETPDGSTIGLMVDTLKSLRGIASDTSAILAMKQMGENFKQGKFSAPHVKKTVESRTPPKSDELGAQPTKPNSAKKEDPHLDKIAKLQEAKKVNEMYITVQRVISALVKASRKSATETTADEVKTAVSEVLKMWTEKY